MELKVCKKFTNSFFGTVLYDIFCNFTGITMSHRGKCGLASSAVAPAAVEGQGQGQDQGQTHDGENWVRLKSHFKE